MVGYAAPAANPAVERAEELAALSTGTPAVASAGDAVASPPVRVKDICVSISERKESANLERRHSSDDSTGPSKWSDDSRDTTSDGSDAERSTETKFSRAVACQIAFRVRHVFLMAFLMMLQHGTIGPSLVYISTSFFAGPGNNCEETPTSEACKYGAVERAFWESILQGITKSVGWFFALTLGSLSDSLGRRPILRFKAVMAAPPILCLALHEFSGLTLWVYMISSHAVAMLDVAGVMLAVMSDLVPESELRALAYAVVIVGCLLCAVPVLILGLLPAKVAIIISIVATVANVLYFQFMYPETSKFADTAADPKKTLRGFSCVDTAREVCRVFIRHSFIFRMVIILVVSGLSAAGIGTIMAPYATGYLGMTKRDGVGFALAGGTAIVLGIALLKPVTGYFGEVRVLRFCLGFFALFPLLLSQCTTVWQFGVILVICAGPCAMQFPIMAALKSNLVSDDEQGLVQGALAAIRVAAVAVSDVFFGWLYRLATNGGQAPRSAALGPLLLAAALGGVAFVISCSLPLRPPPAPPARHKEAPTTPKACDEEPA